jgi:hypothetical protein
MSFRQSYFNLQPPILQKNTVPHRWVRQVVLQSAQARHSERRALARSEPTCGLESTQA